VTYEYSKEVYVTKRGLGILYRHILTHKLCFNKMMDKGG